MMGSSFNLLKSKVATSRVEYPLPFAVEYIDTNILTSTES
jgi:hypothetical protein